MLPAFARPKHEKVEARTVAEREWAETTPLNFIEDNGAKVGVIVAGSVYKYAKEALGDTVNYLKLGVVNPLPVQKIRDFAAGLETVYVIEELDDIIINDANLWLDSGHIFGKAGRGFQRLNIACPWSTLEDGLEHLAKAFENR